MLTLSEAMCHDGRLDLAGRGIGQAEEALVAAVLGSKAAATGVRFLDISKNPMSVDGAAGIGKAVAGTQIETIVFGPKSTELECGEESWDLSGQSLGAVEAALVSGLVRSEKFAATLAELNLSDNPLIGSATGYEDKRDPSGLIPPVPSTKPGVYPKGSFVTVDGSRWGEVTCENDDSVDVKWLDDGSGTYHVEGVTMAVADRGLVEHVGEPVYPGVKALCSGLPATSIARLDLGGIGLTAAGLVRLGGVLALKSLNLKDNAGITESDVELLRREAGSIAIEM